MFDKKSVDKLHKPKRKEAMTELLKLGLGHLQCYRHPKLLNVLHGPEESSEALAFASEPVIGSLANILSTVGSIDYGLMDNKTGGSSSNALQQQSGTLLKVDYSFIDVEFRYGFSQVSSHIVIVINSCAKNHSWIRHL